jgi:branched-chain amino acid transport system substrate-binding protein
MSKTTKIILGVVVIVVIILLATMSGKKGDTGSIKVGFVGPLTGDLSSLGQASKAAVELAVEDINMAGGISGRKIEVIYEDGKCSPVPATGAVQKLINIDKVVSIIGGLCSSETSSFIKLASDAKVPVISYCSSAPSLSNSGEYFFRTYPSDSYQGKYAAEYAYNILNVKKISILYHISDWGTGIKDVFSKRFTELGGTILSVEGTPQEAREYKTQLTKIKSLNPDYIYMPVYTEGAKVAVQQMIDLGMKTKILAADAWNDPSFVSSVNKNADILYVGSTGGSNEAFKQKYLAKTSEKEVPICAPQAYDAATAIIGALKQVGTDSEKLPMAIGSQDFDGVAGRVKFDQNGDVVNVGYVVKRIANGQIVDIK